MTHHNLGVAPALLAELLLGVLLEAARRGGKQAAGDDGSHCGRGLW